MHSLNFLILGRIIVAAASLLLAATAVAQSAFPSKPITWVVGFPPGGGQDAVVRLVAAKLAENLGQSVLVENKPGASAMIAAQYVAQAAPDGHTILTVEQSLMIFNKLMYSKVPYDAERDFTPITNLINAPLVLAVHPSFEAKDLKSFIELVKKQPGKLNYGGPGRGVFHHLGMEALMDRTGLEIVSVQYKGIAPAVQDLIAGQIPIATIDTVVGLPHIKSGKLRALATYSTKRLPVTPDVPALGELGFPELDMAPIAGVAAPKATPRPVIAKLHTEIVRALRDPTVTSRFLSLGLEIVGNSPEEFQAFLDSEAKRWVPLIKKLNIKLD